MQPNRILNEKFRRIDFSKKPIPSSIIEKPTIVSRDTERYSGKDFRINNIVVVEVMAELIEATFGPRGLDKMILGGDGVVYITNDCQTIFEKLEFDYPIAKSIGSLVKTIGKEIGDGKKTAVLLTGELLTKSRRLIESGYSPHEIIEGYEKAGAKAIKHYRMLAKKLNTSSKTELRELTNMAFPNGEGRVADICVEIALILKGKSDTGFDIDDIRFSKMEGGTISDSKLIDGFAIRKELADESMPRKAKNASILVLKGEIRDKKKGYTGYEHNLLIESPHQVEEFRQERITRFRELVKKIKESGSNVVILEQGIEPIIAKMFSNEEIMVIRRFVIEDLERIAKATGAEIVYDINDVSRDCLGFAKSVEMKKHKGFEWLYIEGCPNPQSLTFLLKGHSEKLLDEWERRTKNAISILNSALKNPQIVPGGGAADVEVARMLIANSHDVEGREHYIFQCFAGALMRPIETLIKNAGMDPLEILSKIKAKHSMGEKEVGFDGFNRRISNTASLKIFDLLVEKEFIIPLSIESIGMILRIDDYIKSKILEGEAKAEKKIEDARSEEFQRELYKEHKLETAEP